jgi:hypothetical protein
LSNENKDNPPYNYNYNISLSLQKENPNWSVDDLVNMGENIIFNRNISLLKYIMVDIDLKFDESYTKTRQLPYSIRNEFANMNFGLVIKIL